MSKWLNFNIFSQQPNGVMLKCLSINCLLVSRISVICNSFFVNIYTLWITHAVANKLKKLWLKHMIFLTYLVKVCYLAMTCFLHNLHNTVIILRRHVSQSYICCIASSYPLTDILANKLHPAKRSFITLLVTRTVNSRTRQCEHTVSHQSFYVSLLVVQP